MSIVPTLNPLPEADAQRARVLATDAQILEAARRVAQAADVQAAERDARRILPAELVQQLSESGFMAATVPREHGGADVGVDTLIQAFVELADADPALAQIPQNHFAILERLRLYGSAQQKAFFYPRILAGDRLGNATAEPGDRRPNEHATRLQADGDGFRISGRKVYSTGALFAQWVPVSCVDDDGKGWVVFVPRQSDGLTVIDDWDSFGQRTTASGTTVLDDVWVDALYAFPSVAQAKGPDTISLVSQLVHIGIDLGIARRAIRDTITHLKTSSNPARGSGVKRAVDDTLTLREIGQLQLHFHAAEALTTKACLLVDLARPTQDEHAVERALLAVIDAKILSTEIALEATTKLFELVGTHSTARTLNLDRHWRNARTHTLHDGVRWKYVALGQYYVNDLAPDTWALGHPFRPRAGLDGG